MSLYPAKGKFRYSLLPARLMVDDCRAMRGLLASDASPNGSRFGILSAVHRALLKEVCKAASKRKSRDRPKYHVDLEESWIEHVSTLLDIGAYPELKGEERLAVDRLYTAYLNHLSEKRAEVHREYMKRSFERWEKVKSEKKNNQAKYKARLRVAQLHRRIIKTNGALGVVVKGTEDANLILEAEEGRDDRGVVA